MFASLKIKHKLFILTVLMALGLVVVGVVALFSVNKLYDELVVGLDAAEQSQEAINTARSAQVHFKIQVQEWKDILLRGNNKDDLNKYFEGFEAEEKNVQQQLAKLKTLMQNAGLPTDDVDRTIKVHSDLGALYRSALKAYDIDNPQSYQVVDDHVRGIDRAPTEAIDKIVEQIDQYNAQLDANAKQHAFKEMDKVRAELITAVIVIATMAFVLALIISRQVIKPINTMKRELTLLAENGGDLTQQIDIQAKDEMGELAHSFNQFIANLRSIMMEVNKSGNQVEETAGQLTGNS